MPGCNRFEIDRKRRQLQEFVRTAKQFVLISVWKLRRSWSKRK
jgi:hypothetical protein